MELKVHVDNTIRTVCGLSQDTTVEEIIKALVTSIKQAGNFILIENFQTTKLINRRLPRIMSPDEKPIEIIFTYLRYLDNDEDIEFHLIRTNDQYVPDENDQKEKILIKEIDQQCKILEQQSNELNSLIKEIQDYENINSNLLEKSELNTKELIKRKILILDLQTCLNNKKLNKLETNKEQIDEAILNKEIEFNLFLNAQHDYYKRKLELAEINLASLENDYEHLKNEYNYLIDSLPVNQTEFQDTYDSKLKYQFAYDCAESSRQFEINKAQLNYLETSTLNLDETIRAKSKILQNLEADFQNLLKCETNIKNIRFNEINYDALESSLFESSSSSECLSDDAQETNDSISNSRNFRKANEFTANSANQRYSRIRRLARPQKSPAVIHRNIFNYDDIHYF
ncbi:unnamed protein product [Brachionus calyciflorus]|uniref:Ras association domain-containing protein 8 n=1 Tax=Brachionus calyciflorus TaxID=104777 RepID=A0A813WI58_9BILA|nr:unnamed protein product [Brachionus calyciflorus]